MVKILSPQEARNAASVARELEEAVRTNDEEKVHRMRQRMIAAQEVGAITGEQATDVCLPPSKSEILLRLKNKNAEGG